MAPRLTKKILGILLAFSICLNLVLFLVFAYKLYHHWFEPLAVNQGFRESIFAYLPQENGKIYFVGDSHTQGFELNEWLGNPLVRNRGIWGDFSANASKRCDTVAMLRPKQVFIMIGVNDMIFGKSPESVVGNVAQAILDIQKASPQTKIILQSVLPTDNKIDKTQISVYNKIVFLNAMYKQLEFKTHVKFLNLFPYFVENNGLRKEYSFDGLHLNGKGYKLWAKLLTPILNKTN